MRAPAAVDKIIIGGKHSLSLSLSLSLPLESQTFYLLSGHWGIMEDILFQGMCRLMKQGCFFSVHLLNGYFCSFVC